MQAADSPINDDASDSVSHNSQNNLQQQKLLRILRKNSMKYQIHVLDEHINQSREIYEIEVCLSFCYALGTFTHKGFQSAKQK
jgi:hypothetical protein